MSTRTVTLADQIRSLGAQAGIYHEAGIDDQVSAAKERAAELMRGTESGAIIRECRTAWALGLDSGRRAYLHLGNCEPFPASARPFNPSPKMRRAIEHGAELDAYHERQSAA